jgi:hypothetical protein
MTKTSILGRAWIYDDDPNDIEVWEHELVPMTFKERSGAEWCLEHLQNYTPEDLREVLKVPKTGNFQVIFKGTLEGEMSGYYEPEWDEWFELEESKFEPIPDTWMEMLNGSKRID